MSRTIPELIQGANLFVPTANDFFTIDTGGLPNGDDAIIVNAATGANDVQAYVTAPTLSPNLMKVGGAAYALSFWVKIPNATGVSSQTLWMGCQNSSGNGTNFFNDPINIKINRASGGLSGLGTINMQQGSDSGYNTSTATFSNNTWNFVVFNWPSPGTNISYYTNNDGSLTTGASRQSGTTARNATQFFYIGRYSTGMAAQSITTAVHLGKITFHDHPLTLTECQGLYLAMTT